MADRSGRFAVVPARALDDTRMTPAQLRTLVALCTYADRDGWCWPRLTMLARRIGVARPALSRDVAKLVEHEYLEVHPQFRLDGSQRENKYRVLHDRPLPRAFDRWRPEVVDDSDVVITDEDFAEPGEGGVSQGDTPPVAPPRGGVSQDGGGPPRAGATPRTDQENGPGERSPLPRHETDERRELARQVVGEWWESKRTKPLISQRTIEKLVDKALAAGHHASVIRLALDACNTYTAASLQLALSQVPPAHVIAAAELAGDVCPRCHGRGILEDPDDPTIVYRCDHAA